MEFNFPHAKTYRAEIKEAKGSSDTLMYVLHGYGQLARYFIRKFTFLPEDYTIVAPEGMHRFYLNGHSGRVGASWMTKEAREADIQDNINWLSALDARLSDQKTIKNRILLGFSQGGSTAIRWALHHPGRFDKIVIWGSDFPPDVDQDTPLFRERESHFVVGDQDEFIQGTRKEELVKLYASLGFHIHHYAGGHDIYPEMLLNIVAPIA